MLIITIGIQRVFLITQNPERRFGPHLLSIKQQLRSQIAYYDFELYRWLVDVNIVDLTTVHPFYIHFKYDHLPTLTKIWKKNA